MSYKKLEDIPAIYSIKNMSTDPKFKNKVKDLKPHLKFLKTNNIFEIFYKVDKYKIHGYIIVPKKITKPIPAIIYCKGGYNALVIPGQICSSDTSSMIFINFYNRFIPKNTICITTNYRGSRKSTGDPEYGKGDIVDIKKLYTDILQKFYYCNKSIGLFGISNGTFSALHLLTTRLVFTSVILLGIVVDDSKYRGRGERRYNLIANGYNILVQDVIDRQPINILHKLNKKVPYLIINGSDDWRTPVANSLILTARLIDNGIHPKLIIYPNGGHVPQYSNNEVIEWITKYTINKEKLPEPIVDLTSYTKEKIKYPTVLIE